MNPLKDALRRAMRPQRRALSAAAPMAGQDLASLVAAHPLLWGQLTAPGAVVAGYHPLPTEMDVLPLLSRLAAAGVTTALPEVTGRRDPLRFRRWQPGQGLTDGPFKTVHPPETAEEVTPTAVLVPLLAFDASGFRLGYGGGFYDRTLHGLRAAGSAPLTIGAAFSGQALAEVPTEGHDEPLDWIVTELAVVACGQR
ncbi:5-formyltetrahydrofolate cyclo-ligase [Novispirillum itersonii]|uniref:5-formyltetrahydrofolate cyclo-ligase n=1 Tax=Novispirillum itersonii TaxID=189 RepID=A0A7W9ZHM2_NOVIT|nr:5-formyltetrahydrofolate cyclo-ligase [Novispirillum itersonii]MBB6210449.1 5-formyltetrahydrofolate cyclo-ligase [Novispirillum itersonii]